MHLKRWITSIVALPILFLLLFKGGRVLFAVFIGIVCLLGLREFFRIVYHQDEKHGYMMIPLTGFFVGPLMIWAAYMDSFRMMSGLIALNLMLTGTASLIYFKKDQAALQHVLKQVLGIAYIPLFLSYLVLIRNGANGVVWICFVLCIVFSGDVGAYYTGSYLGKHKLCPAVSPKKTIEGSIGGVAANVMTGALFKLFFLPALPWGAGVLFFISAGIAGQVGDLFESEYKRVAAVKDSGAILPGHGGILDRIDALLFAAPVAYYFKEYIL